MNAVDAFERFVTGVREGLASMSPAPELPPITDPLVELWANERDASARRFLQDMYAHGGIDAVPMAAQDAVRAGMSAQSMLEELEKILEKVRSNGS